MSLNGFIRLLAVLSASISAHAQLTPDQYVIPEGMTLSPVALPGLVKHPMVATFDDQGRLFVAESAGLNYNKEKLLSETPNFVRLLEDTDDDGVFDKATIFADKMTFPQGVLWVDNSLYVMSPPSLWRLADDDGDGRAEVREELATGFDFTGNAADVHGPFLHPNGRLYWCHGRKNFTIRDEDTGQILDSGKGARIWSSQLGGGEVEAFAGGGMDNPVEIDFTEEGEILGTVNLFYGRPRGDTLTHWIHGGAYPRFDQELVLEEFKKTGDLLPPIYNFGHVAVSGMCRYRSGALNAEWKNQWLVSHFNTSKITRTKLSRSGASFEAVETESILEITKPDAHLTDVLEDPHGDIIVVDTGGWFRIGCPNSQIAKPEITGGIYRLSKTGSEPKSYRIQPDWERLTSEEVSGFLDHESHVLRERSGLELAFRGDPAMPELRRILRSPESSVTARRNAVWTLTKLKFSESTDLIYEALTDESGSVRQAAANAIRVTRTWQSVAANQPAERQIELERNRTISGALAAMVRNDEPHIARAAAGALGAMAEFRAIGALVGRLGRAEGDRLLEHAIIYALIEIDDFDSTNALLSSENPQVVRGILIALREMPSSQLEALDVLPHLTSPDEALRKEAIRTAQSNSSWDAALVNRFYSFPSPMSDLERDTILALAPGMLQTPPTQAYVSTLLKSDDESKLSLGFEILSRAEKTGSVAFQAPWAPAFKTALLNPGPNRNLALTALSKIQTKQFDKMLQQLAGDESQERLLRIKAVQALASTHAVISPEAFSLVIDLLKNETDPVPRSEAIGILTSSKLTAVHRDEIADILGNLSVLELGAFTDLMRKIDSPEQARKVADILFQSPAFPNIPINQLRRLFAPYPSETEKLEEAHHDVLQAGNQRDEKIAGLVDAISTANPANGKTVFESGKGTCVVCHQIGESGGKIGPSLTTIGRIRTPRDLFESILYPSESIARDFETFQVSMKDKSALPQLGLIEKRTAESIELIDLAGQAHQLARREIDSIKRIPASLMPMGLDKTMSEQDLLDLVAWLLEQK